jgi:hypothetical protein
MTKTAARAKLASRKPAHAPEPFHYTASGLENVWLLNGFTVEDTPYGPRRAD